MVKTQSRGRQSKDET